MVWDPVRRGDICVPLILNSGRNVCGGNRLRYGFPVFSISGCIRWKTSAFCSDVEAVIAFLFPYKFEVEWHDYGSDIEEQAYLSDRDGSELDACLPAEHAFRIRAIMTSAQAKNRS